METLDILNEFTLVDKISAITPDTFEFILNHDLERIDKTKNCIYSNSTEAINLLQESKTYKHITKDNTTILNIPSMDIIDILETIVSTYESLDNIIISDEQTFMLLFVMKVVAENNPMCKTINELINTNSKFIKNEFNSIYNPNSYNSRTHNGGIHDCEMWYQDYIAHRNDQNLVLQETRYFKNLMNTMEVIYCNFLKRVYFNLCTFINDQVTFEAPDINSPIQSSIPKVASIVNFIKHNKKFELVNFDSTSEEEVHKLFNNLNVLVSIINDTLNTMLKAFIVIKNVNFKTVNIDMAEDENNKILSDPENFKTTPLIQSIITNTEKETNSSEILEDLYYFAKYNIFPLQLAYKPNIIVEDYTLKHLKTTSEIINNFKFPNGIYRDKASLNIFTNLILDLITKVGG